jgi:hypothetical protein
MLFSPFDKAGVHISGFGFLTEQGRHFGGILVSGGATLRADRRGVNSIRMVQPSNFVPEMNRTNLDQVYPADNDG